MSGQFINFEQTPLGRALKALVLRTNRDIEFFAFSREGFPAVTALVSEVAEVLQAHDCTDTKERNFAKQSVGAFVAEVMTSNGYEKVGSRSVPGKTFTTGAVWKKKVKST